MKAEPDAKLNAAFRPTDGWVGGDGAFSVPLSDKRVLWLFSDTWVGSVRDGKRKAARMVNNSVGVQEGSGRRREDELLRSEGREGQAGRDLHPAGWEGLVLALRGSLRRR